ncbi:acylphosphatase [Rhodobacteraceae bacterium MCCB 386]|nr:acylphosphatase [Roseitranquillus sediminis]
MEPSSKAVRARVEGRVQGVSFRAWVRQEAEEAGLSGWVRNEADGSVAALIAGEAGQVDRMIATLRRGPPLASVSAVQVERAEPDPWPEGFKIRR